MRILKDHLKQPVALAGRLLCAPVGICRWLVKQRWRFGTMEDKFSTIYHRNVWGDPESVSGGGSSLAQTEAIRQELPALVKQLGVRSLLDVPCGDLNWIQHITLDLDRYIGVDIVPELIAANRQRFSDSQKEFLHLDITRDDLPRTDLILCRDLLVHFSFEDAFRALASIGRSGSTYLLATTFASLKKNHDTYTGDWRRLNLQRPPFSFPEPLRLINERHPARRFADKSLALWRIADISAKTVGERSRDS